MSASPRWASKPNPDAPHDLAQVRRVAAMLGTPLMPWQALTARLASEKNPDGSWRFKTMVVTVPRQSGKTTLLRAIMTQRAMTLPDWSSYYTAQTLKDAEARWKDLVKLINRNPVLASYTHTTGSNGKAVLTMTRTGSTIAPFAPTADSLHGYTPPFVALDEAFSFTEAEGTDLLGAIMPAQQTLANRQLWLISTKGHADATWFQGWVDRGRAAADDPASTIGHVEYCAPDDADLYDPNVWATYHPALGHTITADTLAEQALHCPPGEWTRAYGNQTTNVAESVIDLGVWDQLADPNLRPPATGRVGLGFDVHHDRSRAAVWLSWIDQDGRAGLVVIGSAAGMEWLPDRVKAARDVLGERCQVTAHDDGPARQVTDQLRRDGVDVTTVGGRDYVTACGAILWRANTSQLVHDGTPALRDAWAHAAHRPLSDGWAFSRHMSSGSIADLNAALLAIRAADLTPAAVQPEVWFA